MTQSLSETLTEVLTSNDLAATTSSDRPGGVAGSILGIPVTLQVVIGTARMSIGQIADLRRGSVIALEQKLGAPVILLANGKEVARGEIFVMEGEDARLAMTIGSIAAPSPQSPT